MFVHFFSHKASIVLVYSQPTRQSSVVQAAAEPSSSIVQAAAAEPSVAVTSGADAQIQADPPAGLQLPTHRPTAAPVATSHVVRTSRLNRMVSIQTI